MTFNSTNSINTLANYTFPSLKEDDFVFEVQRSVYLPDTTMRTNKIDIFSLTDIGISVGTKKYISQILYHLEELTLFETRAKTTKRPTIVGNLQTGLDLEDSIESIMSVAKDLIRGDQFGDLSPDYLIKLLEDIVLLITDLTCVQNKAGYVRAIVNFVKLRTGKSFMLLATKGMTDMFETIFKPQLQSDENVFDEIRSVFEKYEEFQDTPIFKKVHKFLLYCLSASLFDNFNINFKTMGYGQMESESLRRGHSNKFGLIHCILDTITFLCQKGWQCFKMGSLSPIFHSERTYHKWAEEVATLKLHSTLMSNPDIHGLDRFEYLRRMDRLIDEGQSIAKFAGKSDKRFVCMSLNQIKLIKATEITQKFNCETRRAPFSVLVAGPSSVGKSTFKKILEVFYAKLFKLSLDPEFFYTVNPFDEFMSSFKSYMHTATIDDIAFWKPSATQGGDPTIMSVIQLINNVAFITPQAELEHKGRVPFMCKHVIATTNTEHLNAHAYFACPLAVQRRFPYIVSIKPKPEFIKNSVFLDGEKIPPANDVEFPDLWRITVKKIVPLGTSGSAVNEARIEEVATYENIHEFLQWYGKMAMDHEKNQDRVLNSHVDMVNINICERCLLPDTLCKCVPEKCDTCGFSACSCDWDGDTLHDSDYGLTYQNSQLQSECDEFFPTRFDYDSIESSHLNRIHASSEDSRTFWRHLMSTSSPMMWYQSFYLYLLSQMTIWCLQCSLFSFVIRYILGETYYQAFILYHSMNPRVTLYRFKKMGRNIHNKIGQNKKLQILCAVSSVILTSFATYKLMNKMFTKNCKGDLNSSLSSSIGQRPSKKKEERENVWFNDSYEVTSLDTSSATKSRKNEEPEQLVHDIQNNLITVVLRWNNNEVPTKRCIKGVGLVGNIFMFNAHSIPEVDELSCTLVTGVAKEGINSNIKFTINRSQFKFYPQKDYCLVELRSTVPRKSIMPYFASGDYRGKFSGIYASRDRDGELDTRVVKYTKVITKADLQQLNIVTDVVLGNVDRPTTFGDCGNILIAKTTSGPMILGMHTIGNDNLVSSILLDRDELLANIKTFSFQLQAGEPLLSAPSAKREIGELHRKSVFRFLESGHAEIYGSYVGFRANQKSNVVPTFIQENVLAKGYTVTHDKPVMNGWAPWRIAALELVDPNRTFNTKHLEACKQAYITEILSELTENDLSEVIVYDDATTINGIAGYRFVDKMNRATSAGSPWNVTKKKFMVHVAATPDAPDPVEFTPEIMERVDDMISKYHSGTRACPIFRGTLKDEPTSFKKISAQKTRVFCGGPVDFSIVTRKYYLSLVRLIQKNKFIFESAPGTVCQSQEWSDIYEYLTQFGTDNMVAGDYKCYDKKMSPQMILAAFDILIAIAEKAGYSEEDIKVMRGVAVDTAYAYVDFNGDLVQFFGGNPSGHSLTVIINCLVGCLYVRMAFIELTNVPITDFKQYVKLLTYGDDNVMNIHESISDKFNHTSISSALANVGITYTMADKEAKSVPLLNIKDISFLKRTWRWDSDVEAYLCPLEHESINKMLTMCVASKSVSPEAQSIAVISSAIREYFFYGKETFNRKRKMFREIISECDLSFYEEKTTLPTWEACEETFWSHTKSQI